MTLSVTHTFVSGKSDGADSTLVQPSNWNEEHVLAQLPGTILGAVAGGSGQTIELPVSFTAGGDPTFGTTGYMTIAKGTTGQRPVSPAAAMFRFNSTTGRFEGYDGSSWSSFLFSGGVPTVKTFDTPGADTYTPAADVVWFRVRMWAGGASGGGCNLGPSGVAGNNGGTSTFNGVNATGGKAAGGVELLVGGAGGSGGSGTSDVILRVPGQAAQSGSLNAAPAAAGGGSGAGAGRSAVGNGRNAVDNSGGGGGGAALSDTGGYLGGPGGGSGEYVELLVTAPSGTYNLTVGAGGTAPAAVNTGGEGGSGLILIEEFRSP